MNNLDNSSQIPFQSSINALMIVSHPNDEVMWGGGLILKTTEWRWTIISISGGRNRELRRQFFKSVGRIGARGLIGDLDDDSRAQSLPISQIETELLFLLPRARFDLILTHSPFGEYTHNLRHKELSLAVQSLWEYKQIKANELWFFAFDDNGKSHLPTAIEHASVNLPLSQGVWMEKKILLQNVYDRAPDSFESRTTPRVEAFWRFQTPVQVSRWKERYNGPNAISTNIGKSLANNSSEEQITL